MQQSAPKSQNYSKLIASLVKELSAEKAAQLYSYARFLRSDSSTEQAEAALLTHEDAIWDAALKRNADKFTALKSKARADARAGKGIPAFDKKGNFALK